MGMLQMPEQVFRKAQRWDKDRHTHTHTQAQITYFTFSCCPK